MSIDYVSISQCQNSYFFKCPRKGFRTYYLTLIECIIEQVTEFNLFGLIIDSNLNWKAHLIAVTTKISRIIGLLHKLKYIFLKQVLHSIYNSLIMPHLNYSLLAWRIKSHKIEQLHKMLSQYSIPNLQLPILNPYL